MLSAIGCYTTVMDLIKLERKVSLYLLPGPAEPGIFSHNIFTIKISLVTSSEWVLTFPCTRQLPIPLSNIQMNMQESRGGIREVVWAHSKYEVLLCFTIFCWMQTLLPYVQNICRERDPYWDWSLKFTLQHRYIHFLSTRPLTPFRNVQYLGSG